MLSLFLKKTPHEAPQVANSYVSTTTLTDVVDPFDARALWKARGILVRTLRLHEVLDEQRYPISDQGYRVSAHVELELPARLVEYDRKAARGERCRALETELARDHRDAFSKELAGAPVRYRVSGNSTLPDDCVRVRVGPGVYIPETSEQALWRIEVSADNGVIYAPAGKLYAGHTLLVIGGNPDHASLVGAAWPFERDLSVVVMEDEGELDVSAEPFGCLEVARIEPRGGAEAALYKVTAASGEGGAYLLRATRLARTTQNDAGAFVRNVAADIPTQKTPAKPPRAARSPLRIFASRTSDERVEPGMPASESMDGLGAEELGPTYFPIADAGEDSPTFDDGTIFMAPPVQAMQRSLSLVGLAIPRPGHCGAQTASYGFLADGRIAGRRDAPALSVRVDHSQLGDMLSVVTGHGERSLGMGEVLPLGADASLEIVAVPSELENYAAFILLSPYPRKRLGDHEVLGFGRQSDDFRALRVLRDAEIKLERGGKRSAEGMLSRRHFELQPAEDGVKVTAHGRVVQLDGDLQHVAVIEEGAERSFQVGDHLLAGPYLLRVEYQ